MLTEVKMGRTWKQWERKENPRPIQIYPSDLEILTAVFRYRYLNKTLLHALLGRSIEGLRQRLALLFHHGYLDRPNALRPTKVLAEEMVCSLGKKGARLLEPHLRIPIGQLDWSDQRTLTYVDHQLGVAQILICFELACARLGLKFEYNGHFHRRRYRLLVPGREHALDADAYFVLQRPDGKKARYFVEYERAGKDLRRVQHKSEGYFTFWEDLKKRSGDEHLLSKMRVLIVGTDPSHCQSLRRAASFTGRNQKHPATWRGLFFTDLSQFDLDNPERTIGPIWRHADSEAAIKLA